MPSYGLPIAELAKVGAQQSAFFIARVAALNEDGSVSLDWGAEPVLGVPTSSAYVDRKIGDAVLVARSSSGLIVIGTTNTSGVDINTMIDDALGPVTDDLDALAATVTDIGDNVTRLDDVRPRLAFGTGAAPAGFLQASAVWFKDQGGGRVDLYVQTGSDPGTGSTTPPAKTPPPVVTHAKPVTLTPDSRGSWRPSGQTDPSVWQGDWTGRGNWAGGWFYGASIAAACSGKAVARMTLTLSRTNDGSGWGSAVPAHISLHSRTSKGKPSALGSSKSVKLSPGQAVKFGLPADWVSQLASGSARGFMASGSGRGDYLKFGGSAGRLVIDFK